MKTFSFFTLFFVLLSCTKELDLDIPPLPQKVVVNSLFCPDSVMKIHVSLTARIKDEKIEIVQNATVKLYEDEVLIKTMTTQKNGFYNSFYHPQVGKNYKIEVAVPNFEVVWAEDKIPENPVVNSFTCKVSGELNAYGGRDSETTLNFNDINEFDNYYQLCFFSKTDLGINFFTGSYTDSDQSDLSIKEDSDLEFNPKTYYFTDKLFNNTYKNMLFYKLGSYDLNEFNNTKKYHYFVADLKSVSEEYYNFRKSWTKHVFNQNTTAHYDDPITLLFLGDPIEMYSNIQGGYGIFAGYNQQIIEVTYIE